MSLSRVCHILFGVTNGRIKCVTIHNSRRVERFLSLHFEMRTRSSLWTKIFLFSLLVSQALHSPSYNINCRQIFIRASSCLLSILTYFRFSVLVSFRNRNAHFFNWKINFERKENKKIKCVFQHLQWATGTHTTHVLRSVVAQTKRCATN